MQAKELVTVVLPTRNRPGNIAGQLRLFAKSNLNVIVADSSDADHAGQIRAAAGSGVKYLSYPPEIKFFDKLADVIAKVEAPFVVLVSDRKITFPHAIESAFAFLQNHENYVSAQGYVIGFGVHGDDIDINRVVFFTPTIDDDDPLDRLYHLMRRYQSRQFSLFRLKPLLAAVSQARTVDGTMFQEVMFMNALVLQGRVARLQNIFTLQTVEQSFSPLRDIDPLYWFLDDPESFFRHYLPYRRSLARFISENGMTRFTMRHLDHALDTIHAVWLNYNFTPGVLNIAAQQLLDGKNPDLPHPRPPLPWRRIKWRDVTQSRNGGGRYIWRKSVLKAEPSSEIRISRDEIKHVERQLDIALDNASR